jgi:hypothetical protein
MLGIRRIRSYGLGAGNQASSRSGIGQNVDNRLGHGMLQNPLMVETLCARREGGFDASDCCVVSLYANLSLQVSRHANSVG